MSTLSITSVAFIIAGIVVLAGKGDKFTIGKKENSEKYYIKRLRIIWGITLILVAVIDCIFKDSNKFWFYVIVAIMLLIVANILQHTWAKKKDSNS